MKYFSLEEARELLPALKELIHEANADLERLAEDLVEAGERCESLERRLARLQPGELVSSRSNDSASNLENETTDNRFLRDLVSETVDIYESNDAKILAARYREAAESLASQNSNFYKRVNYWVNKISSTGCILRDLQTGLLDFPARQGELIYYLCWRASEADIEHWHLPEDGAIGRKPLAVLIEYE